MFCPKCGAQNADGASFCSKCGAGMTVAAPPPAPAAPAPRHVAGTERTSGMAITALVLGIVGLILNFISVLAIVFGAIAIGQTNKDPNLKGKGMAIAGLVLGIVVFVIWIILIIWIGSAITWFYSY